MKRTAIAAVMALAAWLLLPGSAAAEWTQAPCDKGELKATAAQIRSGPPPALRSVYIPGVVTCSVTTPGAKFIIGVFEPDASPGYYDYSLMVEYSASPAEPTTFTVVGKQFKIYPPSFGPIGLCIMPNETTRLSCVHVSTDLAVTQISSDDPSVRRGLTAHSPEGPVPECATCFAVTP